MKEPAPRHFASRSAFRQWLARNHAKAAELWIGFYKKHTGRRGLAYDEAVEEALCFGWIDGLRKSQDGESYRQRFTPRRVTSIWSEINLRRVAALAKAGLMAPAGLAAFRARDPGRTGLYSFENRELGLDAAAKREETRARRLAQLIADSRRGERIAMLRPARREAR